MHLQIEAAQQRRARLRRQTGSGKLSITNTSPLVNSSPSVVGMKTSQAAKR